MATTAMATSEAAAGGGGLCCSPNDRRHVFRSDHSPPPHQSPIFSCPRLILRATNEYALSFSSTSLTCTALLPLPTSRRPRTAMAPGIWMTSSLEEERESLARIEELWKQFFRDPSQWWDKRFDKKNPKYLDFKHKATKEALWIENRFNPPWVYTKLAAMVQCQEQGQSGFSTLGISDHAGSVIRMEHLWQEFFSDPSQWWDNRFTKKSPKYPDFKHKITLEGLWLDGRLNPSWVKAKMATMALDHIESSGGLRSRGDKVSKLCQEGRLKEALHMVKLMVQQTKAPIDAYVCLLKACARGKALAEGKQVHALIVQSKLDSNIFLANNLVDMYSKCGSVSDAHKVFSTIPQPNVFSWTALISAYADSGQGVEAVNLFQQMQETGIAPDKVAFVVVLKVCARIKALEQGKQLHSDIIKRGFEVDVIIGSTLVDMYAKCGCLEDARELFNNMSQRNVVSWNVMIAGYAQNGLGKESLALYDQMQQEGVQPDIVTFVVLLKACASITALERGKKLHSQVIKRGLESDVIVRSTLVDMYAKCGCLEDARELFNNMSERNVVSWTVMISGYAQNGLGKEALALYEQMKQERVPPDKVTFIVLLKGCASIAALEQGKQLHSHIIKRGFEADMMLGSTLVDMYAKCGCTEDARELFNNMRERDVVSWNAMIAGYAQNGLGKKALALYEQMQQEGVQPDNVTFVVLLNACASIAALEQGKQLHSHIINRGFESDVIVGSSLVDMYAKCGCLEDAHAVFNNMNERNVVSWNVIIAGYAQNGLGQEALALYKQMKQEGVQPDDVTFVVLLKACASIAALEQGKQLHSQIIRRGFEADMIVRSTLVDMYAKCGCTEDARELFNNMRERDVVSWNAMIAGYAQNGLGKEALALYEQMQLEGVQPNNVTFVVVLKACASIAALEEGKQLHSHIIKRGFESDVIVGSSLVDMYAKCGCLEDAHQLFNTMSTRNVVSWNAMIAGYAQNGLGKEALALYEQMKQEGVQPDNVTYICVLSACSRSGLVDEGRHLFDSMCKTHGVTPTMEHYACMVDLLGRAGCLADAEDFIIKLPIQPDTVIWMTLLGAARNYGHVEIGRRAFDCVVKLEPENASAYVLLSNIYADAGRMDEVAKIRKEMKDIGLTWMQLD